jgi:hypothetical protein
MRVRPRRAGIYDPAPAPITPEERQKFVTRGIFPGSFLVPGTNTSFGCGVRPTHRVVRFRSDRQSR